MENNQQKPWYRKKAVLAVALLAVCLAGAHLTMSWPHNFLGKAVYRLLGKQLPAKKSEDLANIKSFLKAKRLVDKQEYAQARTVLENLKIRVQPNFLFFREIYLYLGYIYDIQGDFKKEESLYSEVQGKDVVLSKFLYGLYYFRHGQDAKARENLSAALVLDSKYHRLNNEFKNLIHKTIAQTSKREGSARPPDK